MCAIIFPYISYHLFGIVGGIYFMIDKLVSITQLLPMEKYDTLEYSQVKYYNGVPCACEFILKA
jgi:type III secretory pathway component EscT